MWRWIPTRGRTQYEVNEKGVVRTTVRHRVQRPTRSNGYPSVWLKLSGKRTSFRRCMYVHKLVAIAFWDQPKTPDEFDAAWYAPRQVRHKDHNRANPALSNLYCTRNRNA